jgi:uncharacterized protein VirK/YbjX
LTGHGSAKGKVLRSNLFMRMGIRIASELSACASYGKNIVRRTLMASFPIGYEILFTPGNWDEPVGAMISGHRKFVRLMRQPGLRALLSDHPPVVYRPYRRYLATSFTKKVRRTVLSHHYAYLLTRVGNTFFSETLRVRPRLWRKAIGQDVFAVRLSFPGELHHEGDLLLEFLENSVALYHLSFSIAPGYLVGSDAGHVILIARVQGVVGQFEAIRRSTKVCFDVAPPYLLMAAVQGIAEALHVGVLAGVRNAEQITANVDEERVVHFSYDGFWRTNLGTEVEKFFLITVPIPEKPLAQISTAHRGRTRAKRYLKSEVAECAKETFQGFLSGGESRSVVVASDSDLGVVRQISSP